MQHTQKVEEISIQSISTIFKIYTHEDDPRDKWLIVVEDGGEMGQPK